MKTLSPLLILLLLFSCKKENSKRWTEVTVRVNNYLTGEPIDNDVSCAIIYYKNYKNPLKTDKDIVLNVGKPVNGVYHYGFKAPKAIQYGVFSWNDNLYPIYVQQFLYYKTGKKNEFQMYLVPMGYLRNIYKNVNCFDDNDLLFYDYIKNIDIPDYGFYGNLELTGCNIDIVNSYSNLPIGNYEYKYSVTKNGVTTNYIDTIEVKVNQYTDLIIEY
jgi:hypothetical protein